MKTFEDVDAALPLAEAAGVHQVFLDDVDGAAHVVEVAGVSQVVLDDVEAAAHVAEVENTSASLHFKSRVGNRKRKKEKSADLDDVINKWFLFEKKYP